MRAALLGGGFGLYGYLPALVDGLEIVPVLAEKYRGMLETRAELTGYMDKVDWVADEAAQLAACEMAIVARPPALQVATVRRCLAHKNITHLLLEKPLATTAEDSAALLDEVVRAQVKVRVGYNFRQTPWGKRLKAAGGGAQEIRWAFMAHHYAKGLENWKRSSLTGGGALRFYGVHVLALLAEVGYDSVAEAMLEQVGTDDTAGWTATLIGKGLVPCRVRVDSKAAETDFMVKDAAGTVTQLREPFAEKGDSYQKFVGQDGRVPLLVAVLRDLCDEPQLCYSWYGETNSLWQQVEAAAR